MYETGTASEQKEPMRTHALMHSTIYDAAVCSRHLSYCCRACVRAHRPFRFVFRVRIVHAGLSHTCGARAHGRCKSAFKRERCCGIDTRDDDDECI